MQNCRNNITKIYTANQGNSILKLKEYRKLREQYSPHKGILQINGTVLTERLTKGTAIQEDIIRDIKANYKPKNSIREKKIQQTKGTLTSQQGILKIM